MTVAPELLARVDLTGRVVTGDALYAQKNLSRQVVSPNPPKEGVGSAS